MGIDLNAANRQAQQAQVQANDLHDARALLLSFQKELNLHWRGQEVDDINNAISNILKRLMSSAEELNAIAADVPLAAQEVRRQEDLANAREILSREDQNVANLRRVFENTQRQHNLNPSTKTQSALNTAQANLNNAIRTQNVAAERLSALT